MSSSPTKFLRELKKGGLRKPKYDSFPLRVRRQLKCLHLLVRDTIIAIEMKNRLFFPPTSTHVV